MGGEDEFCGDDVSGQRTGRRQIGDIAFGTAGSVIGLQAEGFTIGGGGIVGGQSGEGGDSGDGGDGVIGIGGGAYAGFAEGHSIGKTSILDAIGVLRFNDRVGGEVVRGAAGRAQRCGLGGEDEFVGYDVSVQCTGVGCGQVGADAVLIVGGESEGFAVGGGGISEAGEGGDAGCGGLSAVAKGAGRGFGQGHRLGEIGIGVAGGILGGDDGLCGQGRTTDGPRRRGGKSYGGGGDVECGTGAIGYGGVGSADLGASTRDGQVGIAVYGEDQGLVFAEGRAIGSLTLPDAVSVPSLSLVVKSQVSL